MTSQLLLSTATLLVALDLIGTFVFALSGAAAGVKHKLDAFGVAVLAFIAGNAGGVTRDLLIGAVPPAAIRDWRYVAVSLAAGGVTFLWYPNVKRLQPGKAVAYSTEYSAVQHDCSTLGGNSGSPVVDLETNEVIGLHFGGRYGVGNYAVPLWALAEDPLLRLGDLNFQ